FPAQALLQPDQKIVVVGGARNQSVALARYNPDGTPDTGFGNGGTVVTSFGPGFTVFHTDAVLQSDGRIIVVATRDSGIADVLRYNSDGSLDNSFGTNGVLPVPFGGELVVLPNGNFILASNPGLTEYNFDGTIATSFGQGGTASTTLPPSTAEVAAARQPD